jgi:dTDP-4-amino-4,6-dideoxygalactose transaminase
MMTIPFNKPYITGKEQSYINEVLVSGKLSGDGPFTKKCQRFFEQQFGFKKALLTTSCTDALEMAAILLEIREGDEVIAPSYTFVSTVNPFVMRGARIVFADSEPDNPNLDAQSLKSLITPKTKAIIPVHYAGVACDMDCINTVAARHGIYVVEDAAQAIDSYYKGVALGSIGSLSAFSFHDTKNITSGEGGLLGVNDEQLISRAEIIWEKGTNRPAFFRGEVDKYGWVDVGSSFLPSELTAAFLSAQTEHLAEIQRKRRLLWDTYQLLLDPFSKKGFFQMPSIPPYASNNAHLFYIVLNSLEERGALIAHLKSNKIQSAFHYQSLHKSPFYKSRYKGMELPNADRYTDCLLRLPLYVELQPEQVAFICECIHSFFDRERRA